MARPLRWFVRKRHYFITNRTLNEHFWLVPDLETNNAILRALGAALRRYRVRLVAFVFMSNHFHLVVQVEEDVVSDFVGLLQSRIARILNPRLGRRGAFWQRRFSAIPIVDAAALQERIQYTVLNPVRAGLVSTIDEWPGIVSHFASGATRELVVGDAVIRASEVSMQDKGLAFTESNVRAMGAKRVLATRVTDRPSMPARRPSPVCHASNRSDRLRHLLERRAFYEAYRAAAAAYRRGEVGVLFPDGSYPPSRHPLPRYACAA